MKKTLFTAEPGKQEVVITRTFDAPREQVFMAFIDPELLLEWSGPASLTTVIDKLEAKTGGSWRYVQRDSEGNEYAFHGVFHDISSPERIVQTFEYEGTPGHAILETITFEEVDGKTLMTDQSVYQSVEDRDGMIAAGMESGAVEGIERLAAILEGSK